MKVTERRIIQASIYALAVLLLKFEKKNNKFKILYLRECKSKIKHTNIKLPRCGGIAYTGFVLLSAVEHSACS